MVRLMILDSGIGNRVPGHWAGRHIILRRSRVIEVVSSVYQDAPNAAIQADLVCVLRQLEVNQQLPDDRSFDSVEDYQGCQSAMAMIDAIDSPRPILVVQWEES
jgi:hypothetical protein